MAAVTRWVASFGNAIHDYLLGPSQGSSQTTGRNAETSKLARGVISNICRGPSREDREFAQKERAYVDRQNIQKEADRRAAGEKAGKSDQELSDDRKQAVRNGIYTRARTRSDSFDYSCDLPDHSSSVCMNFDPSANSDIC